MRSRDPEDRQSAGGPARPAAATDRGIGRIHATRRAGAGERGAAHRGAPRTAVAIALATLVVFLAGSSAAVAVQLPGFDAADRSLTVLGAAGASSRWVARMTLALVGAGLFAVAGTLPRQPRAARLLLAGAGLGAVILAWAPPVAGERSWPHLILGGATGLAFAAWPLATTARLGWCGRRTVRRAAAIGSGLLVAGLMLAARVDSVSYGKYERLVVTVLLGWVAAATVSGWWALGHRLGSRHARLTLATGALTVACIAGGLTATVLAPVTASTTIYQARLSLSPAPQDASRVVVNTILGDLTVRFGGLGPGVRVSPQVGEGITERLSRPGASIRDLQPSQDELDDAIREAAVGLGIRFLEGALAAALLGLLVRWLWVRRRLGRRTFTATAAALVLAVLLVAGSAASAYRNPQPREFAATGLLGAVQENASLFDDVEARSAQVAPYLRNLLAITAALRERYQETPIDQESVLRILLVSDVHAANAYPLMRSIVEDEGIDIVLDAGDLLNFGTVQEGEISGVFRGIESLGVPYVFVRGNHDATGPDDNAVLARMSRIPNVVLLQPNNSSYREFHVAGVTIAGFNDPRWFGDDGRNSPAKMQPAKERWLATYANRPMPDIVMSHEPWAVQGITGTGVLINGHMHSAAREGNRIQAGTFTGGGPLTHFIATDTAEEMVGQPYAFDVLDFGPACRLTAVTRYTFENVIEGRPSYDDLALINGSTLDTRPVDPLRSCRASDPVREVSIAAVTAE